MPTSEGGGYRALLLGPSKIRLGRMQERTKRVYYIFNDKSILALCQITDPVHCVALDKTLCFVMGRE